MDEGFDFIVNLRREVLRHSRKRRLGPGIGRPVPADEPVGYVDVVDPVLLGAVLLEEVGHLDAQLREFRGFLAPGLVAVNVREGGDGTALEDVQPGIELRLAAGGEPEELGDEAGADDGGLLGFDEGHGLLGEEGQEVFAEEALAELPFLGKLAGVFHQGVYPGDAAFGVLVLDAVAGLGVVFHYFAGAYAALDVNLVEDDGSVTGDADAVFIDQAFEDDGVEDGGEEAGEVAMDGGAQALCHDLGRYGVPFVSSAGSVHVDGNEANVPASQLGANAVDSLAALGERNVFVFRDQQGSVEVFGLEGGHNKAGDFAVVRPFKETAVRGALSCSFLAVSVVDQDFHRTRF